MIDIVKQHVSIIAAWQGEFKHLHVEVRKIKADTLAVFIASRSTRAEVTRLLHSLPHNQMCFWRARLDGRYLADGTVYRTGQRRRAHLSLRDIDRLVSGKV